MKEEVLKLASILQFNIVYINKTCHFTSSLALCIIMLILWKRLSDRNGKI